MNNYAIGTKPSDRANGNGLHPLRHLLRRSGVMPLKVPTSEEETKLILPRRRFLFLAPAVVAASNLMPGHSIAHLLTPPPQPLRMKFDVIMRDSLAPFNWIGSNGYTVRDLTDIEDRHIDKDYPASPGYDWASVRYAEPITESNKTRMFLALHEAMHFTNGRIYDRFFHEIKGIMREEPTEGPMTITWDDTP